jgi:uncharacterized protein YlxW (UPF0749 family)
MYFIFIYSWERAIRLLGHRNAKVKPLSEEQALKLGADVAGEILVFGVALSVTAFELNRKAREDDAKKESSAQHEREIRQQLEDRFGAMEAQLKSLHVEQKEFEQEIVNRVAAMAVQLLDPPGAARK